ncbi:1,2-phenylacetyl-CoA epoxidase subunit PaaC [Natrinema sp. J7-2]|uniref:1,2-phenylacetyl-CoA epoxidase subunit PaaC n=1 Tax=Natrinema sp. (strain J7-2) TaxID=406552 RepID=UPI00026D4B79|nr:1,2-phenylacetyl-CoA epoxidase subunit PaaC [Natrinema sp. J7-2]AFO57157.1 phenylacetate-CoA oxygenase, PaaI subunit [Natrinema sp. J7-2]
MSETPRSDAIDRRELSAEQQAAVEELLFRLADDEFVHAERLTEWQIYAPTLESDLAIANIAQDEFGHARLWYDLLKQLGYTEPECIWERDPTKWTHSLLVERSFDAGDWGDAVLRGYLYDIAERIRLEAVADTSYAPLADRVGKALEEEAYHREHATNWLERLTADDDGQARMQDALDELFPAALSLFDPGPREDDIVAFGFRTESLAAMRTEWLETIGPSLEALGLDVPDPDEVVRPNGRGRYGTHTDAWHNLYDEFTATYREVDFETPAQLRATEE